jgi:hypothetical protein
MTTSPQGPSLFALGLTGSAGPAGDGKGLFGIADINCFRGLSPQGVSFLEKPVCQSGVFASASACVSVRLPGNIPDKIKAACAQIVDDFRKAAQGVQLTPPPIEAPSNRGSGFEIG